MTKNKNINRALRATVSMLVISALVSIPVSLSGDISYMEAVTWTAGTIAAITLTAVMIIWTLS